MFICDHKSRGHCDSKRHNTHMCSIKLTIFLISYEWQWDNKLCQNKTVFSQSSDFNFSMKCQGSAHKIHNLNSHNGWQRVWHWTGERYQPPALIAHDRFGGGSVMVWGGSPWLRGQNSTSARGISLGSTTETMSLSLLLCSMPVGMRIYSSFKMKYQSPSCMCCPR